MCTAECSAIICDCWDITRPYLVENDFDVNRSLNWCNYGEQQQILNPKHANKCASGQAPTYVNLSKMGKRFFVVVVLVVFC